MTSPDLRQWTIRETLLETDEGMAEEDVWRYTSFSYVDWQFEGPDVRPLFSCHVLLAIPSEPLLPASADTQRVRPRAQIIYAIRTSYRGGVSFHNTNRITYKRLDDFARYLP